MINSYPQIFNLGHAAVATLLHGPVIVEEKIDGSQISFRKVSEYNDADGETFALEVRSKGAVINTVAPEGMFKKAVEILKSIENKIPVGYTFRGEYLAKPKHNVMNYDRVPQNHIIIFDIETGEQTFMAPRDKEELARSLGFETVPQLFFGQINSADDVRAFLERESVLGGQKVEGVVIKPQFYNLFGRDKKVLMAKFVSEQFKETHSAEWKTLHGPKSPNDILREIAMNYASPARWQKALIHLREEGKITDSPKDIGELMAAVPPDVLKECEQEIKDTLWKWAWPNIRRSLTRGLPEWYKDILLKKQFEDKGDVEPTRCDSGEPTPQGEKNSASETSLTPEPSIDLERLENEGGPIV